jgi:uncharacterized protein YndB with AHSA1/START domain
MAAKTNQDSNHQGRQDSAMEKLHFSIDINASRKTTWDTMLQDSTYREWTRVFNPKGSWYEGDWTQGSTIRFIGPDESGKHMGMVGRIKENRQHEYVSIEHLGIINDGKEDTTSDEVMRWRPAFENYTLTEKGGVTTVAIELDTQQEYKQMFEEMWPKALRELKRLAESTTA